MKRKRGCVKRGLAGLLSAGMLLGSFVVGGPQVEVVAAQTVEELPTAYSSLAEGYMPPVRNQGSLGNCWAYAANALVEISLIKNGAVKPDEIDLSESHTVYYVCRPVADPLGGTDGDYTSVLNDTVYTMFNNGAAIGDTASNFLGWIGPVQEKDFYDYDYLLENHNEPTQLEGLNDVEHAYGKRAAIVTETASVNMINTEDVKRAIMDYGGIGIGYNATTSNYDSEHSSQYTPNYMPNNHAVVIVGWDDSFPKENFQKTPDGDGAWLVRNSWGAGRHVGGYFWLSYYDKTISDGARVYRAVAPDKYDNNYRYDRTGNDFGYEDAPEGGFVEAANIFKIQKEQEILKAVQFGMQWKNQNYSIQVYKNPTDSEKPHTGEALLKEPVQGTRNMPGHYTVDLGQSIVLEKDDVIAVSVTFSSDNPDVWPAAQTGNYGVCNVGESMFRVNGGEWQDCGAIGGKNFIIRAFTSNVTEASDGHQHEWAENWSTNDYAHWHDCEGSNCCSVEDGNDYEPHSGGTASCRDRAVCEECGQEYGLKNPEIHVGGMIRKNVRPASTFMTGYTGDICCAGCNVVFERGEELPMLDEEPSDSEFKRVPNLDFTFNCLDGELVTSKAEGKPKLIVFYGAGCGACVKTLRNVTEEKIDGVDVVAVEVNNSSDEKILGLKSGLGIGKENIHFCHDADSSDAANARHAYEEAYNGMTYSSLPVLCYIDEKDQITQVTSGEQTLNQVKMNLAQYCNIKMKNLNMPNPSEMDLTTLDGEEITLTADGKPKVIIFFSVCRNAIDTFANMPSGTIPGVDLYAIDLLSGVDAATRNFIDQYMSNVGDMKVARSQDAIPEMVKYAEAVNVTQNINYPIICYIDEDNQLQHVTFGVSSLDEIKMNLALNCGFTGEKEPTPSITMEFVKPDKTTYLKGEALDLEGATVAINDGAAVPVDSSMVSGFSSDKEGIITVKVNYQDMETSFDVLVVDRPELKGIEGMRLTEVLFPENSYGTYTWVNPSVELTEAGSHSYEAVFVPTDGEKFSLLENVKIKVEVEVVVVPPQPTTSVTDTFVDIEAGAWYVEPVQYVFDRNVLVGDGNVFAPNNDATRAMIAVILYRLADSPEVTDYSKYEKFTDLSKDAWYAEEVAWALNEGVSTGDDYNMLYNPDSPVTREQLALFLWRYAKYKGENVTVDKTADSVLNGTYVNDWALEGFTWAVDRGLIKGSESFGSDGQIQYDLLPQGTATRAQLARVLQRFLEERE